MKLIIWWLILVRAHSRIGHIAEEKIQWLKQCKRTLSQQTNKQNLNHVPAICYKFSNGRGSIRMPTQLDRQLRYWWGYGENKEPCAVGPCRKQSIYINVEVRTRNTHRILFLLFFKEVQFGSSAWVQASHE